MLNHQTARTFTATAAADTDNENWIVFPLNITNMVALTDDDETILQEKYVMMENGESATSSYYYY
jgi:hypothetical protein